MVRDKILMQYLIGFNSLEDLSQGLSIVRLNSITTKEVLLMNQN